MNDPIEEALSRMKPAEMPSDLMARLTAARARVTGKDEEQKSTAGKRGAWRSWVLRWLAPAGVCAAVAVGTVAFLESGSDGRKVQSSIADNSTPKMTVPTGSGPMPFESEDRLVGAREVGIVVAPNRPPFRLMEVDWVESDTLKPSVDATGVRVETMRRQVLPVALETY